MHYNLLKRLADLCESLKHPSAQDKEKMDDLAQKAMFQCNFLTALLNNNEPEHKKIINTINNTQKFLLEFVNNINKQIFTVDDSKYIKLKMEFFSSLNCIIKDIEKI